MDEKYKDTLTGAKPLAPAEAKDEAAAKDEPSLESVFGELEEILNQMQRSDISLEDAFALFEKGMQRVRQCNARLDMVEKKMKMIAADGSEVLFED